MKIKELIKQLKEVEKLNPNSNVYLELEDDLGNEWIDFTGFSCDDNNDIRLYIIEYDEEA